MKRRSFLKSTLAAIAVTASSYGLAESRVIESARIEALKTIEVTWHGLDGHGKQVLFKEVNRVSMEVNALDYFDKAHSRQAHDAMKDWGCIGVYPYEIKEEYDNTTETYVCEENLNRHMI